MQKLSTEQIELSLGKLSSEWKLDNGFLKVELTFNDFVEAFSFMTAVAIVAEKLNHHPNWENVYNKVKISLQTHDAGGVTDKDFELASKIDGLF